MDSLDILSQSGIKFDKEKVLKTISNIKVCENGKIIMELQPTNNTELYINNKENVLTRKGINTVSYLNGMIGWSENVMAKNMNKSIKNILNNGWSTFSYINEEVNEKLAQIQEKCCDIQDLMEEIDIITKNHK